MSNYNDNPWASPSGEPTPPPAQPTPPSPPADAPPPPPPAPPTEPVPTTPPPSYTPSYSTGGDGGGGGYGAAAPPSYATSPTPPSAGSGSGMGKYFKTLGVIVVAALIGGGVGAEVVDHNKSTSPVVRSTIATSSQASTAVATPSTIRSVLEKVQPAVVFIQVTESTGDKAEGTGMIVSSDGEILTNNHVVDGATNIEVTRNGSTTAVAAHVLGTDATIDTAVIKIDGQTNLPTVEFGSSKDLQVGDEVVAIGNALALAGAPSVTSGIVSAKDRNIDDPSSETLSNLIQTDAAINPGNSGGPLTNMAGQVVGMNTAVIRGSSGEFQNIGFALEIDSIQPSITTLAAGHSQAAAGTAYLGVTSVTLTSDLKSRFSLTPSAGTVVDEVQPSTPADQAGLARFDVITSADGKAITSSEDLVSAIQAKKPGDKVQLEFYRGSDKKTVTVTLGTRPKTAQ